MSMVSSGTSGGDGKNLFKSGLLYISPSTPCRTGRKLRVLRYDNPLRRYPLIPYHPRTGYIVGLAVAREADSWQYDQRGWWVLIQPRTAILHRLKDDSRSSMAMPTEAKS